MNVPILITDKCSIIYHFDYGTDCHLSLRVVQNFYTSQFLGVHRPLQPPSPKWRTCMEPTLQKR